MKHEAYFNFRASEDFSHFDFVSSGKNGDVPKRVEFTRTGENVFNLTMGDIDEKGEINDTSITDNGDRDKVLATVFGIVTDYTNIFPDRLIELEGSTSSRTRLYRMAISIYLDELSLLYEIFAYKDDQLIKFHKNMNAKSFLIKRKMR